MSDWASGYVADIDYVPGFYPEQMPAHLDLVCLIKGVYPPRRDGERFTYCELGCGLGETALTLAACHPEADIHAFDFNPGHIAYAREARAAPALSMCTSRSAPSPIWRRSGPRTCPPSTM